MLNVLFVGIAMMIGTTAVSAQETVKKTAQERADANTKNMTKSLLLTPDQVLKVAELNLEVANKNEAIRNDVNITPERKKEFTRGNLDGRKSQLKLILTPEQFKKLEENEAKRKANISAKKAKKQKTINPSIEVMEEL
ncbi:MAG: hypothetical protein RI883_217 [Bacteroidota bacterium]